ncbi:MAG: phage baseplate assembly protein V [Alphaproteobacteria bacterium]
MAQSLNQSDLERRMNGMISFGTIHCVDYNQAKACVKIGEITTNYLPMIASRAGHNQSWSPYEIGEQVMILSPSGEIDQGWIMGSVFSNHHPANGDNPDIHRMNYKDGAILEYDRAAHHLKAQLPAGGKLTIIGDVDVAGSITASGDITDHTRSMAGDRAIYNNHTHTGNLGAPTSITGASQ